MRLSAAVLIGTVCWPLLCSAEPIAERVTEGNRLFGQNDLEGAMGLYQDAHTDAPESPEISYNIGNVYSSLNKHDEAVQSFLEAVQKGDAELKAQAQFNLGNAHYRKAQQKESAEKLEEALDLAKKSLDLYKQCRHTRKVSQGNRYREDPDLNHNIQFVQREVRRIRDKILKRMKEQQKEQKDQQKQDQQQKQEQQQQRQQQAQQKNQEQQKQEQQKGKDEQKQKEQKAQKMTPEQAQALLKQLTEKEKEEMKKRALRMQGSGYVDRDW